MTDARTPAPTPVPAATSPARDEPAGWTLWTVLRRGGGGLGDGVPLTDALEEMPEGVVVRGVYDVSGLRADADLLIWLHGGGPEALQTQLRRLRRTAELAPLVSRWSVLGVHREAEFTAGHSPAFLRGATPQTWLTVYPFVRSYDWYLLPVEDRKAMLAEHGGKGREFPQVLSNTVAAFGLGDYEWILALEADELVDLVDLMRHLRATDARRHVREEVPFFTGRRIGADEVAEVLW
jgi:chlorite dismutase